MGITYDKSTDRSYDLVNWDNLLSLAEVKEIYGKDRSTIARNIEKGIFKEGIDCKKFGKSWVIDRRRLDEVYK